MEGLVSLCVLLVGVSGCGMEGGREGSLRIGSFHSLVPTVVLRAGGLDCGFSAELGSQYKKFSGRTRGGILEDPDGGLFGISVEEVALPGRGFGTYAGGRGTSLAINDGNPSGRMIGIVEICRLGTSSSVLVSSPSFSFDAGGDAAGLAYAGRGITGPGR